MTAAFKNHFSVESLLYQEPLAKAIYFLKVTFSATSCHDTNVSHLSGQRLSLVMRVYLLSLQNYWCLHNCQIRRVFNRCCDLKCLLAIKLYVLGISINSALKLITKKAEHFLLQVQVS